MYLRGIQYSEMESIMQFIYLGEATFYEERVDAVAKSLEIKELCNTGLEKTLPSETNDELIYEHSFDSETYTENLEEQTVIFDQIIMQAQKERINRVFGANGTYECDQCHKRYSGSGELNRHKLSAHQGVRCACGQCDQQFTDKGNLRKHIKSKHEGIRYACDQCNYRAIEQNHLKKHFQAKHGGIKYACDQCTYTTSWEKTLNSHKSVNH